MEHLRVRRARVLIPALVISTLSVVFAPFVNAAFIDTYSLSQFTLTNVNADGSAMTPDGGLTLILTGGNNGSGLSGTTDLVTAASQTGIVSFSYLYSACDLTGLCDTPGYDFAGYLIGDTFMQLTDTTGDSGSISFNVNQGQLFGFRVGTADNTGEPGILTVSSFAAPQGPTSAVPEPSTWPLVLIGLGLVAVTGIRKVSKRNSVERN